MKMNKKGYMLTEIILASVIAFGIAYFILSMTINLKNKNDDLFVETLITTDKTIISNKLMSYAIAEKDDFDCNKLRKDNNSIIYRDDIIDIVNNNANIGTLKCDNSLGEININIPLRIKQMPDNNYDLTVNYKYDIGDLVAPDCSLALNGSSIVASYSDNKDGTGIAYAGWNSDYETAPSTSIAIDHAGTYTYYVKDKADNRNSCSVQVAPVVYSCKKGYDACPGGYSYTNGWCLRVTGCMRVDYLWNCQGKPITTTSGSNPDPKKCAFNGYQCACYSGYSVNGMQCYGYAYPGCSSGTNRNGACYLDGQSSCTNGFSIDTITCNQGFELTTDNKYCYKNNN